MSLLGRIKSLFTGTTAVVPPSTDNRTWKDIEYFDEGWINRVRTMAELMPDNVSVIDLGCGQMKLKEVKRMKEYFPVDYRSRGEDTIVCDFNKGEYPDKKVDYTFVSGCLEYVNDPDWFVGKIAEHSDACVISYCATDKFPGEAARKQLCWVNSFSTTDLKLLFAKHGFSQQQQIFHPPHNFIFLFTKGKGTGR